MHGFVSRTARDWLNPIDSTVLLLAITLLCQDNVLLALAEIDYVLCRYQLTVTIAKLSEDFLTAMDFFSVQYLLPAPRIRDNLLWQLNFRPRGVRVIAGATIVRN